MSRRSVAVPKTPVPVPVSIPSRLNSPVLVLNKVWYPINLVPATRAFCMLFDESARAVDTQYGVHDFSSWVNHSGTVDEGKFVKTTKSRILIPDVLVLTRYERVPKTKAKLSRVNIYRRDEFTCQYCDQEFSRSALTIDHVLPKSKGGITSWKNCVAACLPCNSGKADKTLAQARLRLKRSPYEPDGRQMAVMLIGHRKRPEWAKFVN